MMFLSREIDITMYQSYAKIHIYTILYESSIGLKFKQIQKCNASVRIFCTAVYCLWAVM